ncbi:Histone acetyltransferase complex subunit [Tulasnella sp. 403]|nr:Histone acetyltransferase complex subunit [Tulasnella sp. 403]
MEEAQQIAQDFISSLDNLPAEIKFIMEEIKVKEQQALELQNSVNRKIQKANPRLGSHSREGNLMERVQPDLDRIEQLSQAKIELAQRLVAIMTRTCGRLDHDINRVRIASGEVPLPVEPAPAISTRAADKALESIRTAIAIPESAPSPPASSAPAVKRTWCFQLVSALASADFGLFWGYRTHRTTDCDNGWDG